MALLRARERPGSRGAMTDKAGGELGGTRGRTRVHPAEGKSDSDEMFYNLLSLWP